MKKKAMSDKWSHLPSIPGSEKIDMGNERQRLQLFKHIEDKKGIHHDELTNRSYRVC